MREESVPGPHDVGGGRRVYAARGRILIVDDEAPMRKALRRILGRDHEVDALECARTALARLAAGVPRYDVVFCDLMMPNMSGIELFAALGEVAPEVCERVVFLTGGIQTREAQELIAASGTEVIEKPFDIDRLRTIAASRVKARKAAGVVTPGGIGQSGLPNPPDTVRGETCGGSASAPTADDCDRR